jgi:hypothetical protein
MIPERLIIVAIAHWIPAGIVDADSLKKNLGPPPIVGRWDMTVRGPHGDYPSWLEVRKSGYHTLVGSFVGRTGSARPISRVEFAAGRVRFSVPPQWEHRKDDLRFEGQLDGECLRGQTTSDEGRTVTWIARRAPSLNRSAPPAWGAPVGLFNGKDLTGWRPRPSGLKSRWLAREGLLVNPAAGGDLLTEGTFTDFNLHAEFRYPPRSNSGIYLRGRYEMQIQDDFGAAPECHIIGSIYGFLTPSVNAARKAGEWQSADVTLVGRKVTILLNGERVVDRQEIPGITGGALESDEGAPGPILLQGDHGPIEFRRVTLTPAR